MEKIEIDWEQFDKLIWIPVLSNVQLADILKVSIRTLERHVKEKYENTIDGIRQQKQGPMRHQLFSAMWKSAMAGQHVSQIWLSKNLFGWYDKVAHKTEDKEPEKLVIQFGKEDKPVEMEKMPA